MTLTTPILRSFGITMELPLVCDICHEPCGWSYSGTEQLTECLGCCLDREDKEAAQVAEFEAREEQEEGTSVPCQLCARIIIPTEAATWSKIDGGLVHLPCLVKAETEAAVSVAPVETPVPCAYCGEVVVEEESLDDFRFLGLDPEENACLGCCERLAMDRVPVGCC